MSVKWSIPLILLAMLTLSACSGDDADYKSGAYWLNEKDNWQAAAQAFERSLAKNPDRWKNNIALIDALSRGDDPVRLEKQVTEAFRRFPDSTRSSSILTAASTLLGEDRLNRLGGAIELQNLEKLMASKGDKPELLARAVISACRSQDQSAVSAYLGRMLEVLKGEIPDSVRLELNYFIGSAQLDRIQLSARLEANPDDPQALIGLAKASLLAWDVSSGRKSIEKLARVNPELLKNEETARTFCSIWDISPFQSRTLTQGWDGARTSNNATLLFVRDLGTASDPDKYIFRNSGGADQHTMKAAQQGLREIVAPRFSPDGSWIYFFSSADKNWKLGSPGRFNLYRIKPSYGASPVKLTDDDLLFCEPFIEASGTVLLVRKDVGSVRQSAEVFRVDPERHKSETVIRIAEPVQWAAFTPHADSLLFITSRGIHKRSLAGGATTLEMTGQGYAYPLLSPDGKWLVLQGPDNEQLLFDRNAGSMISLGMAHKPLGWFGTDGKLLVTREEAGKPKVIEYDLNRPLPVSETLLAKIGSK